MSDDPGTGGYYYHREPADLLPATRDEALQDRLLDLCRRASGVDL